MLDDCRHGSGPWTKAALQATKKRINDSITRAAGINGSSEDKTKSWLTMYELVCQAAEAKCCVAGCMEAVRLGGHVWLYDAASREYDMRRSYIAPICAKHNGREYDFPKLGFLLKQGTWLMGMLPHECYTDYDLAFQLHQLKTA